VVIGVTLSLMSARNPETEIDPYRTRLFLLFCSLPQAAAVYFAALLPRLFAEVPYARLLPEGTPFPQITRWYLSLSGTPPGGDEVWPYHRHEDVAVLLGVVWLVAIFGMLWWRRDREVMMRRWIVVTSISWTIVAGWFMLAGPALAIPLVPIIAEMKVPDPPVSRVILDTGISGWTLLKIVCFGLLAAIVGLLWRRDRTVALER
jgi:hypothetical protein